jgi:hypothetical protein
LARVYILTDFLTGLDIIRATRDQEESMLVAVGERAEAADLSAVVDEECFGQCQVCTRRNKIVQIDELAVVPKDRMLDWVGASGKGLSSVKSRSTDNLTCRIDSIGGTACISRQGAQVCDCALLPKECKQRLVALVGGAADNGSGIVQPLGKPIGSA